MNRVVKIIVRSNFELILETVVMIVNPQHREKLSRVSNPRSGELKELRSCKIMILKLYKWLLDSFENRSDLCVY